MAGLLDGITIADLTNVMAGPYGTSILGDLGANVIKIEDVPNGDMLRGVQYRAVGALPPCSTNYVFECLNRNKKSIAVNLRQGGGREIVHRLVKRSDVFVSNLRHKKLEEWDMSYKSLSGLNPQIVYAVVSGYGPKGPDKDSPSFDLAAQARGGLLSAVGEIGTPPPPWGIPWLADSVGAIQLALGIALALFDRERTGTGQEVDVSLLGGQISAGILLLNAFLFTGEEPRRADRKRASNPLRNSYQAKDGKWLAFNMTQSDRYWPAFCQAIGMGDLVNDPRFDSDEKRGDNSAELISILDGVFATKPQNEWSEIMAKNGLVCAPIQNYSDVANDPQVLANEYITTVNHPALGPLREVSTPIHFSKTPVAAKSAAPEYGQHTEEVLLDLGYTWEELGKLKEEGSII